MLACRVGRKLGGRMFCLVSIAFEVVALDFEAACAKKECRRASKLSKP